MDEKIDEYLMDYTCTNCTRKFQKSFKLGTIALEYGVICPKCGCNTGKKSR